VVLNAPPLKNMKPNQEPESDARLSKTLGEWVVNAQLPPRFQEQVWQRIGRIETSVKPNPWQVWKEWIEAAFSSPALASSYVLFLLFVGLGAGYWQAHDKSEQAESQSRERYVQSVDPYQMPRR
jgi:hypothetical protein